MRYHAFVAMPFGQKPGPDGTLIDFNRVYTELLQPALEAAGCTAFRADEEERAGEIRRDMFQELLVADLVLVDLTIDNPNVWYELGVRHALRARGVVLVQGPRSTQPFDVYTDRKFCYALTNGAPDPARRASDIEAMASMVRETLAAPKARIVSPVYSLLPHLAEPRWRDLLLEGKNEFREQFEAWSQRIRLARNAGHPGDILVLAEETPTQALALEARREAAHALFALRHFDFALEQYDQALQIEADDRKSRQRRSTCLGRLGRFDDARTYTAGLTSDFPDDAECWALAGRVEKDAWVSRWRNAGATPAEMRQRAAAADAWLEEAIAAYTHGFTVEPGHYYSGINALTLLAVRQHLGGPVDARAMEALSGGLAWALRSAREKADRDYWVRVTQAEHALFTGDAATVAKAYRVALVVADRDWFALDASRQTLTILRDLEYRPDVVSAALAIVDAELAQAAPPTEPQRVFLFSGHMVDAPTRPTPRFPIGKVEEAARRIAAVLAALDAGPGDLALCQGAAGGDLLFLEACQARGVPCQMMLPLPEAEFIMKSVIPSADGPEWRQRFHAVKAKAAVRLMPDALGPTPAHDDEFSRCNRWLLATALAWGPGKVEFVCLWNGEPGDGRGGTADMHKEVSRRTGNVHRIDVREL